MNRPFSRISCLITLSCVIVVGLGLGLAGETVFAQPTYTFKKIGEPLQVNRIPIVTVTGGMVPRAWAIVKSPRSTRFNTVVSIEINSGKSKMLNFEKYGQNCIRMHRLSNGDIYIYTGEPAHFLKYDFKKDSLINLGQGAVNGWYALADAIGPDGRMWVGAYPNTELCWVDPKTDEIGHIMSVSDDQRQQYIRKLAVSDSNIVYCATGMHHAELWAINPTTGEKRQILPEVLTKKQGYVSLMHGEDGQVYGYRDDLIWRCRLDGVDFIEQLPVKKRVPDLREYGNSRFVSIGSDGQLLVQSTSDNADLRFVSTDFVMPTKQIFNLGPIIDGKLYGGGYKDAALFTYDVVNNEFNDLGIVGGGKVQIYDIIGHSHGVFFTSYSKGFIEHYNPKSGEVTLVAELGSERYQQERLTQLCIGPDGMIYSGAVPVKGILGGGLVRVNPNDLSVRLWRNIVREQSLISVMGVPSTDEVFFTTSIRGGSSAVPSQEEAVVGFWDVKSERVTWQGKPVPGAIHYGPAALGSDGLIYGVAEGKYYVVDPLGRDVVKVGNLPVSKLNHFTLTDTSMGVHGLIYGLGDDALFAIDPATKEVTVLARHESIKGAHGISVADNGDVYYGSGPGLWQAKLSRNH